MVMVNIERGVSPAVLAAAGFLAACLVLGPKALEAEGPGPDCLECHADSELFSEGGGGGAPSLYVEPGEWQLSPHSAVGCAGCHGDVDMEKHPGGGTPAVSWSTRCRSCHGEEGEAIPVHEAMLTQAEPPACSLCHSPHRMKRVREWKPKVSGSIYCLTCHQQQMRVSLSGGKTLSLTIREADRGASVHLDHQCTDCHGDFSKLEHPLEDGAHRKGDKAAGYELCRECHEEQYRVFKGSYHFKLANIGKPDAPVCTDCHGYHAIAPLKKFELLSGTPCRRCHAGVFDVFRKGVYRAKPLAAAHTDVPLCVNCHRAHPDEFIPVRELVNETCIGCHADSWERHRDWLPKADAHLEAVACTSCHAPAARRDFIVRIYDSELKSYVGPPAPGDSALPRSSRLPEGADVENRDLAYWGEIVSSMNKQDGMDRQRFHLELELQEGAAAHEIGRWKDAHRKCESCHEGELQYLRRVFLPSPE